MKRNDGRYRFTLRVATTSFEGATIHAAKVVITSPIYLPLYRQLLLAKSVAQYGAGIEVETTVTEWSGSGRPTLGTFRVSL